MAVKLRLARQGSKGKPYYRIVAADSRFPRDGRFIEKIGSYDPMKNPIELKFVDEKLDKWLSCGAQPSETVASLIKKHLKTRTAE